jgi:hypothetical protein
VRIHRKKLTDTIWQLFLLGMILQIFPGSLEKELIFRAGTGGNADILRHPKRSTIPNL